MKGFLWFCIHLLLCMKFKVTAQYNGPPIDKMLQNFQYFPYNMADQFKLYQQQIYNYPEEYNDYAEGNICSCDNCDNLKPACRNMCPNCSPVVSEPYYYMQYPYQYIITESPKPQEIETTSTIITTTEKVTTTEATSEDTTKISTETSHQLKTKVDTAINVSVLDPKTNDVYKPSLVNDNPYILTSIRRTRPNWIPKYGVLPMSERFAEKLMLKLRSMKVLHPRQDNFRDIDEIKTVN